MIATTESPLDPLEHHKAIKASGWKGRVVTAYRPDPVVDPEFDGFRANLEKFGDLTRCDTFTWHGYLEAHRLRRAYFKQHGATSTDHGHPTAQTVDLPQADAERLFGKSSRELVTEGDAELFRAQMLTEMARMSLDDGLVMQIHPGSLRNHNPALHERFGRDMGADIPTRTDYVQRAQAAARPLRQRARSDAHPFHARRDRLFARACAARRPLSDPASSARPGGSTTARRACAASAS